MIERISTIKGLGIFNNCSWESSLGDFRQYNLIYGWNGSGKTTLTRLFNSLGGEVLEEFQNCEFTIQSEEGIFSNSAPFPKTVRVFSQNYIHKNIAIQKGTTNPIFILGEENKELAEQIEKDEIVLNGDSKSADSIGLIAELRKVNEQKASKTKEKDKLFTNVARLIGASTTGVLSRIYRKPQAEAEFAKLSKKEPLSQDEISQFEATLKQSRMATDLLKIDLGDLQNNIEEQTKNAIKLLAETVESVIIDKLKADESVSNWIEEGLKIHLKDDLDKCEFCDQDLRPERTKALLSHFNDADKLLKEKIDSALFDLRKIYSEASNLDVFDAANLYEEFRSGYEGKREEFSEYKKELLDSVTSFGEALNKKKMNTTTPLILSVTIETGNLKLCVDGINKIVKDHCTKSSEFEAQRQTAATKLERHYLSEIYDAVGSIGKSIETLSSAEEILKNGNSQDKMGITELEGRIKKNKLQISTAGPAVSAINSGLQTFLGRSEIYFSLEEKGYSITRNGSPVKNLSEGEKTAIAFVYFTIHLEDINFDKANGIIVVDDPISSLDSNSLFQAFSFLKNSVSDAHQVFILTHNFEFLRLLLGWLNNGTYKKCRSYYMVKNHIISENREAYIDKLDDTLTKYESEYQYLFKQLDGFVSDGTIASVYHIPNIARKVLETFLMLTFPDNRSIFNKLEDIDFDKAKKTSIYKFTNDQSHMTGKGFDPSIVPECQNSVNYLLEMIAAVFPSHYDSLKKTCS